MTLPIPKKTNQSWDTRAVFKRRNYYTQAQQMPFKAFFFLCIHKSLNVDHQGGKMQTVISSHLAFLGLWVKCTYKLDHLICQKLCSINQSSTNAKAPTAGLSRVWSIFFQESLYSMCCPKNNNTLLLEETYLHKPKDFWWSRKRDPRNKNWTAQISHVIIPNVTYPGHNYNCS